MDGSKSIERHRQAQARLRPASEHRRIFIRDLVLSARIGVWAHEKTQEQRIRINVDLDVADTPVDTDSLDTVVCYNTVIEGIRDIIANGHVHLAETLAERIAALCLEDGRVFTARVRVEKLDVVPDAASVGVEIVRKREMSGISPCK